MRAKLKARRTLTMSTLVLALCITFSTAAGASTVIQNGYDLFRTWTPGSSFDFFTVPNPQTIEFEGLPLGCFDFGTGCLGTGLTDTIVERLDVADLTLGGGCGINCDTIDIELVALSLVSVDLVDLGFGAGFEDIFVTLNTSSPSFQSTMTIFDTGEGAPHGTFDSILNLSFDVTGDIGGFYTTIEKTFTSSNNDWQHAPTGTSVLDGINHLLDGSTEDSDFWLEGLALHDTGDGQHTVRSVPEPGTALLVGVGLAGLAARRRGIR